jgi:hypothetical protein
MASDHDPAHSLEAREPMTRETAHAYWGRDAVEHALRHDAPEPITTELSRLIQEQAGALPPSEFREWALTQPWPRFCTIVWIVSGALRERLATGELQV